MGEYGHRCCIMSARTYGSAKINQGIPAFLPQDAEYSNYGPGYSAASQAARGAVDVINVARPTSGSTAITLRSLGSALHPGPGVPPKAARIVGDDGNTYVISYRNPDDPFDFALTHPAVVIEAVDSGRAEGNYPGIHAATFIDEIRLPLVYGAADSTYQGPGFAVTIVDWDANSPVSIRISRSAPAQLTLDVKPIIELRNDVFDNGTAHFKGGEYICVGGTYDWTLWRRDFGTPIEVQIDYTAAPAIIDWKIEHAWLTQPADTLPFTRPTTAYPPLPYGLQSPARVEISYEIERPDRLVIYNRSVDGIFDLTVSCRVSTPVGSGRTSLRITFAGQVLDMPKFDRDRDDCIRRHRKQAPRPKKQIQIMLPHDIRKRRLNAGTREKVERLMEIAEEAYGRSKKEFEEARMLIARALSVADVKLDVHEPATSRRSPRSRPVTKGKKAKSRKPRRR
jgi:hypothetical protein